MIINIGALRNKPIKRVMAHTLYLTIIFVLIPSFFYFELCVVLPFVCAIGSFMYFFHMFFATFFLHNVLGNLMFGMFTNSRVEGPFRDSTDKEGWTMCNACKGIRPPRAWHCKICDICVLKRDHHCVFYACCVGYYNHRYFMLYTFYIFISMAYAFCFNFTFVAQFMTWDRGLVLVKLLFPLANCVMEFGNESLYVLLVVINAIVGVFTGMVFFYHLKNVLKGKVVYETKHCTENFRYDKGKIKNITEVFGSKWYLTWLSPLVESTLPGNGIDWIDVK